jgi:hypothetical protein
LYVWEKEFPEFLDAKRVAQDARRMWWENVAKDCATGTAKGNPAVIIHTMKCIEPEFYSEKQIVEEKKTVELKDVDLSNLSAEELENFSSTLAKIVQK